MNFSQSKSIHQKFQKIKKSPGKITQKNVKKREKYFFPKSKATIPTCLSPESVSTQGERSTTECKPPQGLSWGDRIGIDLGTAWSLTPPMRHWVNAKTDGGEVGGGAATHRKMTPAKDTCSERKHINSSGSSRYSNSMGILQLMLFGFLN